MFKASVDKVSLNRIMKKLDRMSVASQTQMTNLLTGTANKCESTAKSRATDISQTKGLQNAITKEISPNLAIVRVRHVAALFTEYGTSTRGEKPSSPYKINPINARVLSNMRHLRANYYPFIAAKVKAHPGQKARPYMRPGKIAGELFIKGHLASVANKLVKA